MHTAPVRILRRPLSLHEWPARSTCCQRHPGLPVQLAVAAKRPAADAGLGPGGLFVEILNHYLYFFDQVTSSC